MRQFLVDLRKQWMALFGGMMFLQLLLIGFGVILATGGHSLGAEMTKRMEAMTQIFQTVTALAVIGCIVVGRSRLTPQVVRTETDLLRETMLCLAVGELSVLLGLIGLAKLHLPEYLVTCALVFLVDFGFVLPQSLKLLRTLTDKKL